ncbi:MAG: endonuclease/exonuclease/phosphatase family protein, partial [Pseudonocardiales bacterium]|nr:endonuclease/exonuclease/phosphatase family protein [Pseudonocardiales bacterium]
MTRLRVLTWNVQHAAASRTHQQAGWLATADPPDVVVLTEVAAGETGQLLARLLSGLGYTVHLTEAGLDKVPGTAGQPYWCPGRLLPLLHPRWVHRRLPASPTPPAWTTRGSVARPAMVSATATGS